MNLLQNNKKLGLFVLVFGVMIAFYIFSSQSITTINDEEEESEGEQQDFHNDPYDIFYTHTKFEKSSKDWSVSAEGFNFKRFTESDYVDIQKGSLSLKYNGEELPLNNVNVNIESAGEKSSHKREILRERELVFTDVDQLGHERSAKPVTVIIQWNGEEEIIELEGDVERFDEHYLNHPISLNTVKVPSLEQLKKPFKENEVMIEDEDFIASVSLSNLTSVYQEEYAKTYGEVEEIPLIIGLSPNHMTAKFSFQVNHVDDGDEVSFLYRNEFGNVIEINNLTLESEELQNGMMKSDVSISFQHFGRKQIWAEVNGEKVGEFGISLRPVTEFFHRTTVRRAFDACCAFAFFRWVFFTFWHDCHLHT